MVWFVIIATFASTFLGGLFALSLKDRLHLILGFSAGAVLGVSLFDLLPEAIELSSAIYDLRVTMLMVALGFSIYMLMDRFFSLHKHGDDCKKPVHKSQVGSLALVTHSFLDGIGIGLAFKVSSTVGWVVAAAVLAHDFSDGVNTVGMILKNNGQRKEAIKWLAFDAGAPVVGIIASQFMEITGPTLGVVLSVFAGLFLYIGASDLIPESHHNHPALWTTLSTILGLGVIYAAVVLAG